MQKTPHYQEYLQILEEELLPAMGCTEPISIALAAAKARELLGAVPERVVLEVSGNIIKNVKSVVVPNTGGLKGLEAAAAVGITAGRADMGLEVLSRVTAEEAEQVKHFLEQCEFTVQPNRGGKIFYIRVDLAGGGHTASCEITDFHTNLTLLTKDDEVIFRGCGEITGGEDQTDRGVLSVQEIVDFINCVDPEELRPTVGRQIRYNTAISQEGMTGKWGAAIGRTIRQIHGEDDLAARASAAAAAGSDARMSGCEMPVIIVSGSGNQGMTASLPVIEYANALGASEEQLLRAVALSDLITIHQKTPIGRLSAFCGAVSAGVGAATGVAYLRGGDFKVIAHTIANALAICSGMICDGAKPSCAAKIASAVDAGLIGYHMYLNGNQFRSGEGIIKKGVENTIESVGRLARMGMRETDNEILDIMVNN